MLTPPYVSVASRRASLCGDNGVQDGGEVLCEPWLRGALRELQGIHGAGRGECASIVSSVRSSSGYHGLIRTYPAQQQPTFSKGWVATAKLKKYKKDLSDLGATWVS